MFQHDERALLQSIQDTVSYNINLPLRILDIDRINNIGAEELSISSGVHSAANIENLYQLISTEMKLLDNDLSTSFLDNMYLLESEIDTRRDNSHTENYFNDFNFMNYDSSVRKLQNLETDLFFSRTSKPQIINELFRLSNEWRWYELVWFYFNRDVFSAVQGKVTKVFSIDNWNIYFKRLPSDSSKVIIVGPVASVSGVQCFDSSEGVNRETILESFCKFHALYCRRSLTKRFSKIDMERHFNADSALTEDFVKNRTAVAVKAIEYLLTNCETIVKTELPNGFSRKSFIEKITNICYSTGRLAVSEKFARNINSEISKSPMPWLSTKSDNLESPYTFKISIPLYTENESEYIKCSLSICTDKKHPIKYGTLETKWRYTDQIEFSKSTNSLFSIEVKKGSRNNSVKEGMATNQVRNSLTRWLETSTSRKKNQVYNKCRLLDDWMNQHYLTTSTSNDSNHDTVPDNVFYNFICEYIATVTRSDFCQIYRYTPDSDKTDLHSRGIYSAVECWKKEDLEDIVKEMHELSSNKKLSLLEKSDVSVVYKSIEICDTHFSFSTDGQNSNTSIAWSKKCEQPKTVVATPILVEGRIWGVLEIASTHYDGVELVTRLALSEYASVLSPYFFNITYNRNIKYLGHWGETVFDIMPGSVEEQSDLFAMRICRINMAQSVLILMKDRFVESKYNIIGKAGNLSFNYDTSSNSSINILSSRHKNTIAYKLYRKYVDEGITNISGMIDPNRDDKYVEDMPSFLVLGREYHKALRSEDDEKRLFKENIESIYAYTFNIDDSNTKDQNGEIFGISVKQLRSFSTGNSGPTGMVMIYLDKHMNRHNWIGVNSDVAQRLAQCYDDMLIKKYQQDDMGTLIRHEIKQSVHSLGGVIDDLVTNADSIKSNIRKIPQSSLDKKTTDHLQRDLRALDSKIDNMTLLHEQLQVQAVNIERSSMPGQKLLNELAKDSDSTSNTRLHVLFADMLVQYKKQFNRRGLIVQVNNIDQKLRIRIKPPFMYQLIRNIYDNWCKYAANNDLLKVYLSPSYSYMDRRKTYELCFENRVNYEVTLDEAESWFNFRSRGEIATKSKVEGDGIGMFWLKYILNERHGIDVRMDAKTMEDKNGLVRTTLCLVWSLPSQWFTIHGDDL